LRADLTDGHAAAIVPIAGLGGAGKTQLALEYAYRHTADYDARLVAARRGFRHAGGRLRAARHAPGLPERGLADQQATAAAVLAWLGRHPGWLLIFDNARSAATCRAWLPAAGMGHVILTSRDPNWREVARPLRLPVLPPAEAVAFLQKRSGVEEPAAAGELCDALGDLPLAIELAAAYIEANGISIADYLERYRGAPGELLTMRWPPPGRSPLNSCARRGAAPAALELLNLIAFLAPDDIDARLRGRPVPRCFAVGPRPRRPPALLAHRGARRDHFGASPGAGRHSRAPGPRRAGARVGRSRANLVDDAFPFDPNKVETWSASARLLPHALAAAGHSESLGAALETTGRLLNEVGLYLLNRAQLAEAERSLKRALADRRRGLRPRAS
jgi:hypothetical protein